MLIKKELTGTLPIDIYGVKKQLNIDTEYQGDNEYLQTLVEAGVDYITGEINADIVTTKNTVTIDAPLKCLTFREVPFIALVSVLDEDSNDVTDQYTITEGWTEFSIETENDYTEVTIEFTTGYTTIPASLKHSMIMAAASLYDELRATAIIGTSFVPINIIPKLIRKETRKYW